MRSPVRPGMTKERYPVRPGMTKGKVPGQAGGDDEDSPPVLAGCLYIYVKDLK